MNRRTILVGHEAAVAATRAFLPAPAELADVVRHATVAPNGRRRLAAVLRRGVVGDAGRRLHRLAGPYRDLGKITS